LCSKGVYLNHGYSEYIEEISKVIDFYLNSTRQIVSTTSLAARKDRIGGKVFRFSKAAIVGDDGKPIDLVEAGGSVKFLIEYQRATLDERSDRFAFSIRVDDSLGAPLFTIATEFTNTCFESLPLRGSLECVLDELPLVAGTYRITLWCGIDHKTVDFVENVFEFFVKEADVYSTGRFPLRERHGDFFVTNYSWFVIR